MIGIENITPVILAGGLGTRLRPLAGAKSPKPFLRLFSKNSLFQNTVLRASRFSPPIIVCHSSYVGLVNEHLREIGVVPRCIIAEPYHKGTAAAVALVAFYMKNQGECMLVMPSDHVFNCEDSLNNAVLDVLSNHDEGLDKNIVIFGATPSRAESGYGYIVYDNSGDKLQGGYAKVLRFVEKPECKNRIALLSGGNCLWHTGIFLSRPRIFLNELKMHEADIYKLCERAFYAGRQDGCVYKPLDESFAKIMPLSVDYAVMENVGNAYVCKINGYWNDAGTWSRVAKLKVKSLMGTSYR